MRDEKKSHQELVDEIGSLRPRIAKLEVEYRQFANMLQSLVESAPDIIYRLDESGNIIFINDAVRNYGYTPEELIGTKFFDLVHPEDREKALYRVNERRTGDRSTRSLEIRLLTKGHDPVSFEFRSNSDYLGPTVAVSARGVYTSRQPKTEKFLCTQGIARDMTDRLEAERALREAERVKVFTEMAGAAAHEINQPLTVIIGTLEVVLDKMNPGKSPKDVLEIALRHAERIMKIVVKMQTAHRYITKSYVRGEEIVDFDASSRNDGEA